MTRNRHIAFLAGAAAIPLIVLATIGCGGSSDETLETPADSK
jgi:hypothetical protein